MDVLRNKNTTIVGAITLLAYIVKIIFGVEISAEVQTAILTLAVFIIALLSKDANKSGTTAQPRTDLPQGN